MDSKLWFRARRYGWGWTPSTWQGWLILLMYVFSLVYVFRDVDRISQSGVDTLGEFTLPILGLTALLIIVCYLKGEKPRWRWGGK